MGEPILHPRIVDIISLLYDKGVSIFLNTNGSLLTQRILKKIVNRVDFIILNIFSNREKLFILRKAKGIGFNYYFKRIENIARMFVTDSSIKTALILMYMMPDSNIPFWDRLTVEKEQKNILSYWLENIHQSGSINNILANKLNDTGFLNMP